MHLKLTEKYLQFKTTSCLNFSIIRFSQHVATNYNDCNSRSNIFISFTMQQCSAEKGDDEM